MSLTVNSKSLPATWVEAVPGLTRGLEQVEADTESRWVFRARHEWESNSSEPDREVQKGPQRWGARSCVWSWNRGPRLEQLDREFVGSYLRRLLGLKFKELIRGLDSVGGQRRINKLREWGEAKAWLLWWGLETDVAEVGSLRTKRLEGDGFIYARISYRE